MKFTIQAAVYSVTVAVGAASAQSMIDGWTQLELVDGQQVIYVSTDGEDPSEQGSDPGVVYTWKENPSGGNEIGGSMEDVLNPTFTVAPYKTLSEAYAELNDCAGETAENCKPGWILLRRGDSWGAFPNLEKSGPTDEGWLLIGAYCDPNCDSNPEVCCDRRPSVERIRMLCSASECPTIAPISRLAMVSLEIRGNSSTAVQVRRPVDVFLIEDVFVPPGNGIGIDIGPRDIAPDFASEVHIRRTMIVGRYTPPVPPPEDTPHRQGLTIIRSGNVFVDECVFWHNGWSPPDPGDCYWPFACPDPVGDPTDRNQNVYFRCETESDFRFTRNITADAAAHGCQQRRGGLNENNLYLRNAIALLWGPSGSGSSCQWPSAFAFGTVRDNVVIEGRDIGQTGQGWGIRMQKVGLEQEYKPTLVAGNLLAHQRNGTGVQGISIDSAALDIEVTRNVVYDWTSSSGSPAALKIWCSSSPQENIHIHGNEVQQVNGGELVWNQPSFAEFTYSGNVYYPTAGSCPFRFSDIGPTDPCPSSMGSNTCKTYQEWVATAESDAVAQQINYTDPSRDIESYMKSIGADGHPSYDPNDPITSFMLRAIDQRKGKWDEDFTAARVNCYMRAGFDMAEPCPGDFDSNGTVGVPDLLELLGCWGPVAPGSGCEDMDINFDDSIGVPDLLILLAAWGDCDSCEDRGIVEKEVEDCFDRYEPGTRDLEECLEYVRDTGSFYPDPPGDPEM